MPEIKSVEDGLANIESIVAEARNATKTETPKTELPPSSSSSPQSTGAVSPPSPSNAAAPVAETTAASEPVNWEAKSKELESKLTVSEQRRRDLESDIDRRIFNRVKQEMTQFKDMFAAPQQPVAQPEWQDVVSDPAKMQQMINDAAAKQIAAAGLTPETVAGMKWDQTVARYRSQFPDSYQYDLIVNSAYQELVKVSTEGGRQPDYSYETLVGLYRAAKNLVAIGQEQLAKNTGTGAGASAQPQPQGSQPSPNGGQQGAVRPPSPHPVGVSTSGNLKPPFKNMRQAVRWSMDHMKSEPGE